MRCMDRTALKQMLDEGTSLAEIGTRLGRHESTVAYWLDRHGLRANNRERHAARGGLARDLLESMVEEGLTIAEIATQADRSKATVRYWLQRHGLKTTGRRGRRRSPELRAASEAGVVEMRKTCPTHGGSD